MEGKTENKPADLQVRRMARQIEQELGGLFGIDYRDIEKAIERLGQNEDDSAAKLPEPIEKTARLLDIIQDTAVETLKNEDHASLKCMIELLDHHRRRLERLLP